VSRGLTSHSTLYRSFRGRIFTRMIPGLKILYLQYEDRLRKLKLWLSDRSVRADLIEVFKIIKRPSSTKLETFLNWITKALREGINAN